MSRIIKPQRLTFVLFTNFVKSNLPDVKNNTVVWNAFMEYSRLNNAEANEVLKFGTNPILFMADIGSSYGFFDPRKPNTINIGRKIVLDFEKNAQSSNLQKLMQATILHELVHWALNSKNIPEIENGRKVEMGVAFEEAAYGNRVLNESNLLHDHLEQTEELGTLSRRFESGGNPAAIGHDKHGGWSYGLYQLASRKSQVDKFIQFLARSNPPFQNFSVELNNAGGDPAARAGMEEFKAMWRELASNPEFSAAQHDYIKSTHYDIFSAKLKNKGFDLNNRSKILRDVAWSVSVQHGPGATGMFMRPLSTLSPTQRQDDSTLINAIYDDRSRVDVHFASSTEDTRLSVKNRFIKERAEALQQLTA